MQKRKLYQLSDVECDALTALRNFPDTTREYWIILGKEYEFDHETVERHDGDKFFTAVPVPEQMEFPEFD